MTHNSADGTLGDIPRELDVNLCDSMGMSLWCQGKGPISSISMATFGILRTPIRFLLNLNSLSPSTSLPHSTVVQAQQALVLLTQIHLFPPCKTYMMPLINPQITLVEPTSRLNHT